MARPLVLITGAAGNLGRTLAAALQDRYDVVGLDVKAGNTDFPVVEVDLTDAASVEQAVAKVAGSWSKVDWLRGAGDFNADGRLDIITRSGSSLYVHLRTTDGFAARRLIGTGFSGVSSITAVGDVDGDKRSDLVARSKDGRLQLFRSKTMW